MTIYFRDPTLDVLRRTLESLGATRDRESDDGTESSWTLRAPGAVARLHLIHDFQLYQMELVGELAEMCERRSRVLQGEPKLALIVHWEAIGTAERVCRRFVNKLLAVHPGFVDEGLSGESV